MKFFAVWATGVSCWHRCVQTVGKETAGKENPAMSSASANIDLASLALGDVVTTGKGAKQMP